MTIFDLHMHPMLKEELVPWKKFTKNYRVPSGSAPTTRRVTIDRLIEGDVTSVLATIYVMEKELFTQSTPPDFVKNEIMRLPILNRYREMFMRSPYEQCLEQLSAQKKMVDQAKQARGDVIEVANSFADYQRIKKKGKICFINSIEGAHVLEGNISNLEKLHQQGVAHMVIPHLFPNAAGGCANGFPDTRILKQLGFSDPNYSQEEGLTALGRDLVNEMLEIGMLVDPTHGSRKLRDDIYDLAKAHHKRRPITYSHIGLQEFAGYPINLTKKDVKEVTNTSGIIGLIFMPEWLHEPQLEYGTEMLKKSIDYLLKEGNEDVIGFGSDFDGLSAVPKDIRSPSDYPLVRLLLEAYYTPRQVDKFLYGNAERVLQAGWEP